MNAVGRLVAASLLAVAGLGLAHAGCRVQTLELPVRMVGSRAVATVEINGTPVPLTVDSGAFFSSLTDAAADQLKLTVKRAPALRVEGLTGRIDTRVTTVDKLKLFNGDIGHVDFVVGGNEPGSGTMGLMGRNMLWTTDTEYDLAHGVIYFHFPNDDCAKTGMAYWAGSAPVSEADLVDDVRSKTPALRAAVRLNGKNQVALFDTGATTLVSTVAATRAGIADADLKPAGYAYGAGRGRARMYTAAFDTFEIGGETIRNDRLPVSEMDLGDADLLLGIDFFLSHRIYFSKRQMKMYFTYNGGPVFALNQHKPPAGASGPSAPVASDAAAALSSTSKAASGTDPAATPAASPVPAASPPAPVAATTADDDVKTADQFARRGAASASRGDFDRALADFDRAIAMAPDNAAFLAQRGAVLQALRRAPKALADLDRALELDPTLDDARLRRAALRLDAKDRDGGRADLEALDRTLPPQAQMRLPMARIYLALGQPVQAIAELNQWLPAHPHEVSRPGVFGLRCRARLLAGVALDDAVDDCDAAIDGTPNDAGLLENRGWAYLRLGKDRKAVADFDAALALHASTPSALFGRGLAKGRLGQTADAEADLAAARKLQPDVEARAARIGLWTEASAKP